jgi:hypothetical protein
MLGTCFWAKTVLGRRKIGTEKKDRQKKEVQESKREKNSYGERMEKLDERKKKRRRRLDGRKKVEKVVKF